MDPRPLTCVRDRYRLDSLMGERPWGSIWRGWDLTLERPVAIRLAFSDLADSSESWVEQFLSSAKLTAAVRHSNVLYMLDFGSTPDGLPFMVTEHLEGETLADRLRREGAQPVEDVLRIGEAILQGLIAVHSAGIVHNDLTPQNIFLALGSGLVQPKIIDFDHASRAGKIPISAPLRVGTPEYLAPERCRGLRLVHFSSDLYSLSVVLFEALTGHLPYDDENIETLLAKIVRGGAVLPGSAAPAALSHVVSRAMALRPEDRFANASEMLLALKNAGQTHDGLRSAERMPVKDRESQRVQNTTYEYDVALSYAGEDRAIVEACSKLLESMGLVVFYDRDEQAALWGVNLIEKLEYVYRDAARHCVLFASQHYARKRWTRHELKQVQERAFRERGDYILPLRLDDTPIPGINETTGYVDARHVPIADVAKLVYRKVKGVDYQAPAASAGRPHAPPARTHNGIAVPTARRRAISRAIFDETGYLTNCVGSASIQLGHAGLWDRQLGQWRGSALAMVDEYFATDMLSEGKPVDFSFSAQGAELTVSAGDAMTVKLPKPDSVLLHGTGWRSYKIDAGLLQRKLTETHNEGVQWPSEMLIVTEVMVAESVSLIWAQAPSSSMTLRRQRMDARPVSTDPQIDAGWEVSSVVGSVGCALGLKDRVPLFAVSRVKQLGRDGRWTLVPYP